MNKKIFILILLTGSIKLFSQSIVLNKSANVSSISSEYTSNYFQYILDYSILGGTVNNMIIKDTLAYGMYYSPLATLPANVSSIVRTYTPDPFRRQIITVTMNPRLSAGTTGQVFIQAYYRHGFTPVNYMTNNIAYATSANAPMTTSNSYSHTGLGPAIGATLNVSNIGTAIDGNIRYTIYMNGKLHTHNVHIYDTIPAGAIFVSARSLDISHNITNENLSYSTYPGPGGTTIVDYDLTNIDFSSNPDFDNIYLLKLGLSPSATIFGVEVVVKYPSSSFVNGQTVTSKIGITGNYVTSEVPFALNTSYSHTVVTPDCLGPSIETVWNRIGGSIDATDSLMIGDESMYTVRLRNFRNVSNEQVSYELNLNYPEITLKGIALDIPQNSDNDTLIFSYQINNNPTWIIYDTLTTNNGNLDTVIFASSLLSPADKITGVRYYYSKVNSNESYQNNLLFETSSGATEGTILNFMPVIKYNCIGVPYVLNRQRNAYLTSNSLFFGVPTTVTKTGPSGGQIGDEFNYTIHSLLNSGRANTTFHDMIVADLLPKNLTFLQMNSTNFKFMQPHQPIFNNPLGSIDLPALASPIQPAQIIDNYMGTGRQLLLWDFSGYDFNSFDTTGVRMSIKTKVNPGTPFPAITNTAFALSQSDHNQVYLLLQNLNQRDTLDFDMDGNFMEQMAYDSYSSTIVAIANLSSEKKSRGSMDTTYSTLGNTVTGGVANYRLVISNKGSVGMKNITLVDILPYVGDKNLVAQTSKGSQWSPFLAGPVNAPEGVNLFYSVVEDINGSDLGVAGGPNAPNWSMTLPDPITDVKAIKFEYAHDYPTNVLAAGDSLVLMWPMRVPLGVGVGEIAYNSFGFKATREDNNTSLLASEPLKVGIQIQPPLPNILGNYIWLDTNGNGIQDEPGAEGLNGIIVELYKSSDNIVGNGDDQPALDAFGNDVSFTVSGDDATGNPGYYNFANLENGNYYLKLVLPSNLGTTQLHSGTDTNIDNDINSIKVSDMVVLSNNNTINNSIDIGLVEKTDIEIEKNVNVASASVGDSVTYSIILTNNGPAQIQNLEVQESFDPKTSFVSSNTTAGSYSNNIWTIPSLAANSSETLTIVVKVDAAGSITNLATLKPHPADTTSTNNTDSATFTGVLACTASYSGLATQCDNNGTASITTDDWYRLSLTGIITNGSGSYRVRIGTYTSPTTPSGNSIIIVGDGGVGNPLLKSDGATTYTIIIEDAANPNCFQSFVTNPVQACSNCPTPNCGGVKVTKN